MIIVPVENINSPIYIKFNFAGVCLSSYQIEFYNSRNEVVISVEGNNYSIEDNLIEMPKLDDKNKIYLILVSAIAIYMGSYESTCSYNLFFIQNDQIIGEGGFTRSLKENEQLIKDFVIAKVYIKE